MFKKIWLYGDSKPDGSSDRLIGYQDGEGRFIDVAYDLFWERLGYEVAGKRFAHFEEAKQYALATNPQPRMQACNLGKVKIETEGRTTRVTVGRKAVLIEDLGTDEAGRPLIRSNGVYCHGSLDDEIKSSADALRRDAYKRRRYLNW